uniref:Uncharacterized protein n=1 Tax=Riptortus pedestris TaxID=329032 RepID=R4WHZ7_RIPPE|nr:conserved hypothetical protein [Riptortus pedestris]
MFEWAKPAHCTGDLIWAWSSAGNVPSGAVHGGRDADGGTIYVGRATHNGDVLPAKVCPNHGCAFVCWNGEEITKLEYEVLVSEHTAWKDAEGGDVPSEAIQIGQTRDGEPLYVGRTLIEGTLTIGKVHPSHGVLYVPYEGKEENFSNYEVLILL